jgi:hypothetical protein
MDKKEVKKDSAPPQVPEKKDKDDSKSQQSITFSNIKEYLK